MHGDSRCGAVDMDRMDSAERKDSYLKLESSV